MNNEVKVIYKKLENGLKKNGFINLNHKQIKTRSDMVELAKIFRDPRYETFRIIYMNKDKIVGHESVSTKTPNYVELFSGVRGSAKQKAEMGFYKIKNRMERLGATSYYMVHNHPSGNAKASGYDIRTTKKFSERVEGFNGHLIINENTYTWIDIDKDGNPILDECQEIKEHKVRLAEEKLKKNPVIESIKIRTREDLVYLMHNIKNSKDYSVAILTDASGKIRMILDIPNRFLNMSKLQVKGYFRNLAKINGVTRVFFATQDENAFRKSLEHSEEGTFKDNLFFQDTGSNLVLAEASMQDSLDLFSNMSDVSFMEENKEENKVKVLYKKVGESPKVMIIDNNLEEKQKLVGGLIEVVPYMDNMLIVCNEEGKLLNLPPNAVFDIDYIAGDFFVIGDDYENGDFKSLDNEEILKAKEDLEKRSFEYRINIYPRYDYLGKKLEKEKEENLF